MAVIKYHYALDEHNNVVCIDDVVKEERPLHMFRCIGCDGEMVARMGNYRANHFAHKGNGEGCGTETYLHLLAKRLIKDKFDNDKSFEVGYYCDNNCSDSCSCKFFKEYECKERVLKTIDLKEYYDDCRPEQPIDSFIADLMLSNTVKPKREKVLIEIQVSHKSTQQKKDSGLKIIELYIKSEDDIKKLMSSPIVEHPDARYGIVNDDDTVGYGRFYGFKGTPVSEPMSKRSIHRFYLFPSGEAKVLYNGEVTSCREVNKKKNQKALFEICLDRSSEPYSSYDYGFVSAREHGFQVKNCTLCKYHRWDGIDRNTSFCCLYKKLGTPMNPKPSDAMRCEYYREDVDYIDALKRSMPPSVVAEITQ